MHRFDKTGEKVSNSFIAIILKLNNSYMLTVNIKYKMYIPLNYSVGSFNLSNNKIVASLYCKSLAFLYFHT